MKIPVDFSGTAFFRAFVDSNQEVGEADENNNRGYDSVIVKTSADLGFCKASGKSACPDLKTTGKVGGQTFVAFDIHNYGNAFSGEDRTVLINIPGQWPIEVHIPSIKPGQFWP